MIANAPLQGKVITFRKEGGLWLVEEEKDGKVYQRALPNKKKSWLGILTTNPGTELLYVVIPESSSVKYVKKERKSNVSTT